MRGKATWNNETKEYYGITPAYAGKSIALIGLCCIVWDHPRVCGEKLYRFWTFSETKGSPPRMRGKEAQEGENKK